jgi:hypothetical protein
MKQLTDAINAAGYRATGFTEGQAGQAGQAGGAGQTGQATH